MLLALLLPDPCDENCPDDFKTKARPLLANVQGKPGPKDIDLRKALLKFIGDFSNWDLASNPSYLEVGRGLVKAAHGDEAPLVVDPFAGGGSIPLEALRLGCDAFASDLNPVACLILKVMLEDIPRHGPKLAEELRRVGAEIKKQAEKELGAVLSARSGWRDADRVSLGADRDMRVAKLRRGNSARAFLLAVQEGEPPARAEIRGEAAERASHRESSSRSSPRRARSRFAAGTVTRGNATCPACERVLLGRSRTRPTSAATRRRGCDLRQTGKPYRWRVSCSRSSR